MPIINPFSRKDIKDEGFASSFLDVFAFCLVFSILFVVIYGISHFSKPYRLGHPFVIHLDWVYLPFYAWRSALRMLIAWFFSLVFSLVVGAWAAKSRAAERVLIPLIDILQSVPILSFLPVGVWFFFAVVSTFHVWPGVCEYLFGVYGTGMEYYFSFLPKSSIHALSFS